MRDECTEPVVRENLELQERLIAAEQAKVDLEDRLSATRSEVPYLNFPADLCVAHENPKQLKCSGPHRTQLYTLSRGNCTSKVH